jgi:hypothetical protein
MMETKKVELHPDMSPVHKVDIERHEELSHIVINEGGGMGGSRREILGIILSGKSPNGFMDVKEKITDKRLEINPRFVSVISKVNLTKIVMHHTNSNFPSGKRTLWLSHAVGTIIDMNNDGNMSMKEALLSHKLDIKIVREDDHRYD